MKELSAEDIKSVIAEAFQLLRFKETGNIEDQIEEALENQGFKPSFENIDLVINNL